MGAATWLRVTVWYAMRATSSRITALRAAAEADLPQQNGPWPATQDRRNLRRIDAAETLHDHLARVLLVSTLDVDRGERPRHWHGP